MGDFPGLDLVAKHILEAQGLLAKIPLMGNYTFWSVTSFYYMLGIFPRFYLSPNEVMWGSVFAIYLLFHTANFLYQMFHAAKLLCQMFTTLGAPKKPAEAMKKNE